MVNLTLTTAGYAIIEAADGRDGLAKAGAKQVDMVITDLNMPGMDGMTMIRELRKLPAYRGVPIVFLTTESDGDKKREGKEAGATAWITKPFKQDQLLAIVKKILG